MDRPTLTALVPSPLLVTAGAVGTAMAVPGQGQGSPDGQPEDPDEPRADAETETAEENDDA